MRAGPRVKKLERPEALGPSGVSIAVAEVVRYDLRTVHDAVAGVGTGSGRLMDWARILAYVTGTVDRELLARNEYLAAENRILRAQLKVG